MPGERVMYRSTSLKDEPLTPFHDYEPHLLRALISEFPLAWVTSSNNEYASLLPLVGRFDEVGALQELIGHFAISNPLAEAFKTCPQTTIFFNGPHSYISPSHAGRRNWGPTWNYAQAKITGEVTIDPD
ncbi:MAG: FMN-binding negative transcriptional regulator, partial [Pseudomonadota bacterium]